MNLAKESGGKSDMKLETKQEILSWMKALVIGFTTVLLVRKFIFAPTTVHGQSMSPTLEDNERVILRLLGYQPEQFDVVVIQHQEGPNWVKRIIGMPGQHVSFQDNQLFIDGVLMEEIHLPPHAFTQDFTLEDICQFEHCATIPEGYYLVLGDNRMNSGDSRHIGLIHEAQILGGVTWRFWPLPTFNRIR